MPITTANKSPYNELDPVKTGTFLDKISGIGGVPRKRITEVFGDASVGKSTVCLQMVATAQATGLRVLWADIEFSYDDRYAASLGVRNDQMDLLQERFAEDALDEIEKAIDSGKYDLVVLDSIGGLLPRNEAEKAAGEKVIGGQAGLVARFCRKVVPLLALRNVALVVINHSFVDIMSGKIKTSGGAKLEYHKSLSVRLKVNPTLSIKQGDRKVGKVIVAEVRKNKVASTEGMTADAQIIFGSGFNKDADLIEEAKEKLFEKRGQFFYWGSEKVARGENGLREAFKESDFSEKVRHALAA